MHTFIPFCLTQLHQILFQNTEYLLLFFTAAKFKPFGMSFLLVHVTYKLLCTGPPQRSSPCMLISLIFVKFRTHVTDFLFTDWQRNRTCGDQCCFLLGSHSKVPRGNWFLRALMSYFRVRFQLNGYIFPQIGRVLTSHLLKIVPSLLGGLAGSAQTSWPLIWTISCKRGAVPCACKY